MPQEQLNVRYILFCHYSDSKEDPLDKLKIYQEPLTKLLDDQEYPGLLILFWHPGWLELLNSVGADFNPHDFAQEFNKSEDKQEEVKELLDGIQVTVSPGCNPKTLAERVRFVTAGDLYKIVNNLRGDRPGLEAKSLRRFLCGDADRTLYDTTKVVEAIVHARHIGANVPILRLDWDVLFNDDNLGNGQRLQKAIIKSVKYYTECNNDTHIYSLMFSASYLRAHDSISISDWTVDNWMGAFATRLFPALLATDELLQSPVSSDNTDLSKYFELKTAQEFYGIEENSSGELKLTSNVGITEIGSNPLTGVISGALLCMSDGAMLDLPPASNFHENVTWIDDHLKYSMHRELKHLKPYEICGEPRKERPARVKDCEVKKDRPHVDDIAKYVLGSYLPTLVRGCILDGWIQPDPAPKKSEIELPTTGVFTQALQKALKHGHTPEGRELDKLKKTLETEALKRLEEVRAQWSKLKGAKGQDTFASLWVGDPSAIRKKYLPREGEDPDNWLGWGLKEDKHITSINSREDLNPAISQLLDQLIEDTVTYIEWSLEWPKFIQSIRAVEPGTLRVDLSWKEPK
ncbi:MAG TPA: hypothetical protein DCF68_00820 [Cyanothece sp. UBA12306]|nr:hypothetical protein [Cyanothece sp. UBA12306]